MNGRMPVSRRKARSWRITAALSILTVATLLVGGSLVTGDPLVLGVAGVLGVISGWVAVRLAWNGLLEDRYEHAADRTRLARTYRGLFAERAVEQQEFVAVLATRLARRDVTIHDLRGSLVAVEMRAVEAETTVSTYRRRLFDAEGQIASMGELITRNLMEQKAAREAAGKPPLLGRTRSGALRDDVVPEWADMESDPVAALVAWEEHAGNVAGRHTAQGSTRPLADDESVENRAGRPA